MCQTVQIDEKRESTLKARCALAGVALVASTDDHDRRVYVVSRWAMCKQLGSLDEVEQWIARVGGSSVAIQQASVAAEVSA